MGIIKRTTDAMYAYRFVKLLRMSFEEWDAFKRGIIDAAGKPIKSKLTDEDKSHWTKFHKLVADIKRMLNKGPSIATDLITLRLAYKTIHENYNLSGCDRVIEKEYPILLEMVSGDAGGDAEDIAAGKNSGAIVYPGPKTIKKKKVKRMNEMVDFKTFITEKQDEINLADIKAAELKEKAAEVKTMAFKAIGGNTLTVEATETEVQSVIIWGKTASTKLVEADIAEAYKELGRDGVLTYIKEATQLVWK